MVSQSKNGKLYVFQNMVSITWFPLYGFSIIIWFSLNGFSIIKWFPLNGFSIIKWFPLYGFSIIKWFPDLLKPHGTMQHKETKRKRTIHYSHFMVS